MTVMPAFAVIVDWEVTKTSPVHVGVEPEVAKYEMAYRTLALGHGIIFKKSVTMGLNEIKSKKTKKGDWHVVGLCTRAPSFREVDADTKYWKESTETTRRTLIYHEMTHCFCTRGHDWSVGGVYPEIEYEKSDVSTALAKPPLKTAAGSMSGMLSDGCPMSIMYPYVLNDKCALAHWPDYEREMFDRCEPY